MKRLLALFVSLFCSLSLLTPVIAESPEGTTSGCIFSEGDSLIIGEPELVEDNSYLVYGARSVSVTMNVDKTFAVKIQTANGSCTSTARFRVTGSYVLNTSLNEISSASLAVEMADAPSNWEVVIQSYYSSYSGASLVEVCNYRVSSNDMFACAYGGGYFYTQSTFTIR